MNHTRIIAAATIGALVVALAPKPMALADGAASTRNIIGGAAAIGATLLIINHNKKVHEKYAQDAQQQAALAEQRDNAQAAAQQYKTAYQHEAIVVSNMKREVALQDQEINSLKAQVAAVNPAGSNFVAARPAVAVGHAPTMPQSSVQVVSYGWGTF